ITVPQYKIQRTVGSGDATVAGIAKFLDDGESVMETVLKAISLGVLNARVYEVEKLDVSKINEVAEQIDVELL
ncbi:MAG: tagatose-6-phosphate kinase, partial [Finegoldia magna]|nr:tagatose-6-phosphate kinase [Finegoldia magna]